MLETEIAKCRALLGRTGEPDGRHATRLAESAVAVNVEGLSDIVVRDLQRYDKYRGSPIDYFRPPPRWMLTLRIELNVANGVARRLCDEQQATIDRLPAEAEALLTRLREATLAR